MVVYDADHAALSRTEVFREIADWLDRYRGRVDGRGSAAEQGRRGGTR